MEKTGYKNWWLLTVNGLAAVLFGGLIFFCTEELLKTVVSYFGVILTGSGILLALLAYRNIKRDKSSSMILLQAILTLALGVVILLYPTASLKVFLIVVGIWAVIIGIAQLVILLNRGALIPRRNLFLLNAVLFLAVGVVLFFAPFEFVSFLAKLTGIVTCILGLLMLYFSFLLRTRVKTGEEKVEPGQ